MTRQTVLRHEFVEFIPTKLEAGTLYIFHKYRTAAHQCCCGCGFEVVTPLHPAKWRLTDHGESVSLDPSIGNWSFPCQSHYWIERGRVRWSRRLSERQIAAVRARNELAGDLDIGGKGGSASRQEDRARPLDWSFWAWLRRWLG
jgi:hypothetical protein